MKPTLSLRLRFAGIIIILLILVFGLTAAVRVHQNRQLLRAELTERAQSFANLATGGIVGAYETDNGRQADSYINGLMRTDSTIVGITLLSDDGTILYTAGQTPTVTSPNARAYYNSEGNLNSLVVSTDSNRVAAISYKVSDQLIKNGIKHQIQSIVTTSVFGTIIGALVVVAIVDRAIIRPIRQLTNQAGRISQGDYTTEPGRIGRSDEIGVLARSMQTMQTSLRTSTEQLSELDTAKSEFMMIASHSLRTPITVIKSSLEALEAEPVGPPSRRMLELAGVATQRLSSFAEDLLVVSNLEVGQQSIRLSKLDIDNNFSMLTTYAQSLADRKGVVFTIDTPITGQAIMANRPYLGNAVWNVLDNAVKFTPAGGSVTFRTVLGDDHLSIIISDTGIGIADTEQDKVFDKLHRGTSTEQYDYEGSGIGLYVTKKIIDAHHGTLAVQSSAGQGTTFTITIPLAA